MMGIKIVFLLVFFGIMLTVGFCRTAADTHGFVLGGRNVGPWLTAFAYGTSYFSAVIFVGYAGQFGWRFGIASTWIGIGNALIGSLLAWVILGRRTRIMSQHLSSATMPEFFGRRYNSRALKIAASAITFIFLIPYTASLYNGLSRLFSMAFNVDYSVCVIVMAVLTGVYVVAGGYMATAVNDFIQGIIMIFGIIAVIIAVLSGQGGFMQALSNLADVPGAAGDANGVFSSFFGPAPLDLLGVVLLTSLGTWGCPRWCRSFTPSKAKRQFSPVRSSPPCSRSSSRAAAIFWAGSAACLGIRSSILPATTTPVYDSIVPTMLQNLPDILIGVVIILVLSASMSTLSSLCARVLLNAYARLFRRDLYAPFKREKAFACHPRPDRCVHRHLGRHRHRAAQFLHHLYRADDGHFLGRACWRIPRPVPVRPVLETRQ